MLRTLAKMIWFAMVLCLREHIDRYADRRAGVRDAGVEKSQAEAHVRVMTQIVREAQGDFATKADISKLESEIPKLESEIHIIKWMVASGFVILALMIALRPAFF